MALKTHFEPTPVNIIIHCFTFHHKNQGPNKSVSEYKAEVQQLATLCNFAKFLDQVLHNRIVFGMQSDTKEFAHRERVHARTSHRTYPQFGAVEKNVQTFKAFDKHAINKINCRQLRFRKPTPSTAHVAEKVCYRCRKTGHLPTAWSLMNAKFHTCGKIGHIAKVCRTGEAWKPHKTEENAMG